MKPTVKILFLLTLLLMSASCTKTATAPAILDCNMSVRNFLDQETGVLNIPRQIQGSTVKSVNALIYFRESHGGFQSCFSLTTGETTDLFCEVKYSDKNMRGDNDWLGSVEGNILGDKPAVRTLELIPNTNYIMLIWGYKWPHRQDVRAARTNFNDPVPDANPHLFTFYENAAVEPPRKKSLPFLNPQGPSISTIIGFEDGYKLEEKPDYNDIIIEMCLKVDY